MSRLWIEVRSLIRDFPSMYRDLEAGFRQIGESTGQIFSLLPDGVQEGFDTVIANLDETMTDIIGSISEPTVAAAGQLREADPVHPDLRDRDDHFRLLFYRGQGEHHHLGQADLPGSHCAQDDHGDRQLKICRGGYFKAQFKIMAVVFLILLVGFEILDVHFSILLALAIAFLDFLPFFGTGPP